MNILADIVVGDPHGVKDIDNGGESLIIVRTSLGLDIVNDTINSGEITSRYIDYNDMIKGQGIEDKKVAFSSYYKAWKILGNKLPKYPSCIVDSIQEVSSSKISQAKKDLLLSLSLDKFNNKQDLLNHANKYYKKKLVIHKIIVILSRIKHLFIEKDKKC
jgi:coenzyme F420 hydrogenase subunit beta